MDPRFIGRLTPDSNRFNGAFQAGQAGNQMGGGAATPPPIPGAAAFFIATNGAQAGPFDMNALATKARAGELTRDTLVWKQGMAQWTPAGSVSELASVFNPPPPIPR